jgi:hypothetical protein
MVARFIGEGKEGLSHSHVMEVPVGVNDSSNHWLGSAAVTHPYWI